MRVKAGEARTPMTPLTSRNTRDDVVKIMRTAYELRNTRKHTAASHPGRLTGERERETKREKRGRTRWRAFQRVSTASHGPATKRSCICRSAIMMTPMHIYSSLLGEDAQIGHDALRRRKRTGLSRVLTRGPTRRSGIREYQRNRHRDTANFYMQWSGRHSRLESCTYLH